MSMTVEGGEAASDAIADASVFISFKQLAEVATEPTWLWDGFVAEGELTLLAGHPFAGKSSLVSGLLAAMTRGDRFLGRATARSTAVLVSEESAILLRERAAQFGLLDADGLVASRGTGVLGLPWEELISQAAAAAHDVGHRLLIVDTLAGLSRLAAEHENDAAAVVERLRPLQEAAGSGLAVLAVHHTVKNGSSVRGSSAFSGTADVVIRLTSNKHERRVTLRSESRYDGTPVELHAKLIKAADCWFYEQTRTRHASTTSAGQKGTSVGERLRAALRAGSSTGLTYAELKTGHGISESTAKELLPAWYPTKVARHGKGVKGDPYRWFLPDSVRSATP